MAKLKQNEFYCVACRDKVRSDSEDMCVKVYKNKKVKGGIPALISVCNVCDSNMSKFVKRDKKEELVKKYGKCSKK
jgi:hypothetical protein